MNRVLSRKTHAKLMYEAVRKSCQHPFTQDLTLYQTNRTCENILAFNSLHPWNVFIADKFNFVRHFTSDIGPSVSRSIFSRPWGVRTREERKHELLHSRPQSLLSLLAGGAFARGKGGHLVLVPSLQRLRGPGGSGDENGAPTARRSC